MKTQKEFISRLQVFLFISILIAVRYGSSNVSETQQPSDTPPPAASPICSSLGLIANNVAPFNTISPGNSSWCAYHRRMLSAGRSVRCELPEDITGFVRSSCSCRRSSVSNPCPSASVRSKLSKVSWSATIGWRR
ncbi:hypothetical protein MUK42_36826 [Musa troglodytarum]|uniref:Uncharacterized protein n=1 Tax=Musa troglodytarum TaxID=320322 RepID=A0A9E7FPC9_9LILI|nr:hypothetical protein MUK42_36826 [Musa troglodytarum]